MFSGHIVAGFAGGVKALRVGVGNHLWKRNKKVSVHPYPEPLGVQDTRRREVALSSKR